MNKRMKKTLILFIAALVMLYVIIYIVPKVTGAFVSSYTAEYGELRISDETTGYLVRDEQVYTAANGGSTNRYIKAGTLVRRGTTVMEVSGGSEKEISSDFTDMLTRLGSDTISSGDYTVRTGGVISYYADGYEGKLTPDNMEKATLGSYSKLSQDNVVDLKNNNVAKGEPVFKIVDRTLWYLVCFVSEDHGKRYSVGDKVTVEFEDDFVEAEVYKVDKQDGKVRIILETDYYYEKFTQMRVAEVSLITSSVKGLIIENSSITTKGKQEGVYVKAKTNEYEFVPVNVLITDGKQSIIKDTMFIDKKGNQQMTVEIYDELLKNPK